MAKRTASGRWVVTKTPAGDWHPEEIKAAIRIQGSTLEELSRRNDLLDCACRRACRHPHLDGELAIAEFLSLSPRQIWPSRFRADGSRIPFVRRRQSISTVRPGHRPPAAARRVLAHAEGAR